ncbi:MAG: hypothetical protein KDJ71_01125 [Nitrobacter sp.]|nr:hypothetical protein [Nitrobacter sp.]
MTCSASFSICLAEGMSKDGKYVELKKRPGRQHAFGHSRFLIDDDAEDNRWRCIVTPHYVEALVRSLFDQGFFFAFKFNDFCLDLPKPIAFRISR